MKVPGTSLPLLVVVGWILLALGLSLYLRPIAASTLRIRRQYSRSMHGSLRMQLAAALVSAVRFSPFLLVAIAGLGLVLLTR